MESIAARADSPAWLEAEYAATRAGLIQLRQNVVLLRHADSPDLFYPVLPRCLLPWNILFSLCTCSTKGTLFEHSVEHSVHMWHYCYHSFGIIELRSSLVQCRRLRIA